LRDAGAVEGAERRDAAIDNLGKRGVMAELEMAGEGPSGPRSRNGGHPRLAGARLPSRRLPQDKLAERLRDRAALVVALLSKESFP